MSVFYFCNGAEAGSVEELKNQLENIGDDVFSYHCNKEKNDFYNWLKEGLREKKLASSIRKIRTRKGMIKKL